MYFIDLDLSAEHNHYSRCRAARWRWSLFWKKLCGHPGVRAWTLDSLRETGSDLVVPGLYGK